MEEVKDQKVLETEKCYIRSTHPGRFRSGEWAWVIELLYVNKQPCYGIRFDDGVKDFWSLLDDAGYYEFRSESEMQAERDKLDAKRYRLLRDFPERAVQDDRLTLEDILILRNYRGELKWKSGVEMDTAVDVALVTKNEGKL